MGRGLYATSATFRSALDRCAGLYPNTRPSLLDVLYPSQRPGDERIDDTTYTQPALLAWNTPSPTLAILGIQRTYCLGTAWEKWWQPVWPASSPWRMQCDWWREHVHA